MWPDTQPELADRRAATSVLLDWGAVWRAHDRWLRTVVYARLREPEAVDEVLQEVALAAVRQWPSAGDTARLAPWLYRVAVRQTLLYRRRCGRRRRLSAGYAAGLPAAGVESRLADPLDWLLAEERRDLIRCAVAQLTARDSEILLLKYTENWTYHQIAVHLGLSASAVEARLHRARQRLRARLGDLAHNHD